MDFTSCWTLYTSQKEMTHNLILRTPTGGKRRRGCQQTTFIEVLNFQNGLEVIDEIRYVMMDRCEWKNSSCLNCQNLIESSK